MRYFRDRGENLANEIDSVASTFSKVVRDSEIWDQAQSWTCGPVRTQRRDSTPTISRLGIDVNNCVRHRKNSAIQIRKVFFLLELAGGKTVRSLVQRHTARQLTWPRRSRTHCTFSTHAWTRRCTEGSVNVFSRRLLSFPCARMRRKGVVAEEREACHILARAEGQGR